MPVVDPSTINTITMTGIVHQVVDRKVQQFQGAPGTRFVLKCGINYLTKNQDIEQPEDRHFTPAAVTCAGCLAP